MTTTVPMGFVLVVGIGVFLIAVLQILILAWLVDVAKGARATVPIPMAGVLTPEYQRLNEEFQLHKLSAQRQIDSLGRLAEIDSVEQVEVRP